MKRDNPFGLLLEHLLCAAVWSAVAGVALLIFAESLSISAQEILWYSIAFFLFSFLSALFLRLHFEFKAKAFSVPLYLTLATPVLAFVFLIAYEFSRHEGFGLIGYYLEDIFEYYAQVPRYVLVGLSLFFAFFSVYAILFLRVEELFDAFKVDANKLSIPCLGIPLDDKKKQTSPLNEPAILSLFCAYGLSCYYVDQIYPSMIFEFRVLDTTFMDVVWYMVDEFMQGLPVIDVFEIFHIKWSPLEPRADNWVFAGLRLIVGIAIGLGVLAFILRVIHYFAPEGSPNGSS